MRREKLIELRVQKGWLQEDVAKKLGITTSFYGMIEQGVRTPRIPLALAMEELFGVPVKTVRAWRGSAIYRRGKSFSSATDPQARTSMPCDTTPSQSMANRPRESNGMTTRWSIFMSCMVMSTCPQIAAILAA